MGWEPGPAVLSDRSQAAAVPVSRHRSAQHSPFPRVSLPLPFVLGVGPTVAGSEGSALRGQRRRWLLHGHRGAGLLLAPCQAKYCCPNQRFMQKGDLVSLELPAAARLREVAAVLELLLAIANTSARLLHLLPAPDPDAGPFPHCWAALLGMGSWETGGFPVPPCP